MSQGSAHDPRERVNDHHAEELLATARAFGGHPDATSAQAKRLDGEGIELVIQTPRGPTTAYVRFAEPVDDLGPAGMRRAFTTLARQAAAALADADTLSRP